MLLTLQSVSGPVLPAGRPASAGDCPPAVADDDEVVVCGRRDDGRFRLKPLPPTYAESERLPKAETSLLGGKAAVETEQGDVGGVPSNRVMLRFKAPF